MVNIRNSIEANRRLMFAILTLLVITMGVLAKFYLDQKKENRALRLKMLSMSTGKRNPKPWSQVLTLPKTTTPAPVNSADKTVNPTTTPTESVPLIEQDTHQIASALDTNMRNAASLELNALEHNIALADELISREPDSYSAYKAKLISLLIKEGKFKQSIDEGEIEGVLESMAQFNLGNNSLARREAALMASANADVEAGEIQLDDIRSQREVLEGQLSSLDPNSPELAELNNQLQALQSQEQGVLANLSSLEETVGFKSSQMASEEMVEIPFMRMLAQGNYTDVGENAQSFINEFPNSPQGYFFLVKSMELQGEQESALNIIRTAPLSPEDRQRLVERLEYENGQDPREYWKNLNF